MPRFSVILKPKIEVAYEGIQANSKEEAIEKAKKRFYNFHENYPKIWINHPNLDIGTVRMQKESEHTDQWDLEDFENRDNDEQNYLASEEILQGMKKGLVSIVDSEAGQELYVDTEEGSLVLDVCIDESMPDDKIAEYLSDTIIEYVEDEGEPELYVKVMNIANSLRKDLNGDQEARG